MKVARRVRREATRKRTPPGPLAARPTLLDEGDGFRKPGFSKKRRLEPQITVGLLTDVRGFPLQVHAFDGNTAETKTILPVIQAFAAAHGLPEVTVIADAGMLSEANLKELEDAGLRFIVGARIPDVPYQVSQWQQEHPGEPISDGQIFTQPTIMGTKADPRRRTSSTSTEPIEPSGR